MNIIRNIEINYFRSIHRANLKDLVALNVLSGRNDTGKSNVLKAMNLFFNNKTAWQRDLDFYRDFSHKRLEQVRKESVKGKQFISIVVEFNRPKRYEGSLPLKFKVKRTWHRDSNKYTDTNDLEALDKADRLPSDLTTARRFLAMLLNRVHFEYVPAVKDRAYFDHLVTRLQKALLGIPTKADTMVSETADNLATHIQGKLVSLKDDFERATGIQSFVEPPSEFAALFQSFKVSTGSGYGKVPLALRGDGIQARYVSSVLQYICENSSDFFVWGFEEPENSLEYSYVVDLADDFLKLYSTRAQIFVTTHSPAFTALQHGDNTCYRVFLKDGQSEIERVWPGTGGLPERARLTAEMGFMKIQEGLHAQYVEQSERLRNAQNRVRQLECEINDTKKPLVLVEGKTDKKILEIAWTKCHPGIELPFIVRAADPAEGVPAGGAGGSDSLSRMIESIHPEESRQAIGVFDRDQEGIRKFKKLSRNFELWEGREGVKAHVNGLAFALLLPVPPGREKYSENQNLLIEFLFPDSAIQCRTAENLGLVLQEPVVCAIIANNRKVKVEAGEIEHPLDGLVSITDGKKAFAFEIVPTLDASDFRGFEPLLAVIEEILGR